MMLWMLSPGWDWVYQGTRATAARSGASSHPSSAVWRCLGWRAVEAAVWAPPHAQKVTSMGDRAKSHGRCSWWGDSSPADLPTDALAAALLLGKHSGV